MVRIDIIERRSNMVFKIWEKGSHINAGIPDDVISIGKATVSFGKNARDFLAKDFAEVYLDRPEKLVGIKPSNDGSKGFRISKKPNILYTYMASAAFIKYIPKGRYKFYVEDGLLVFKVPEIAKRK